MKKLFSKAALFVAVVAAAVAVTAGSAGATSTSTGYFYFDNGGKGVCQFSQDATQLTLTSPRTVVYGLGPTADWVRLWYRLVRTDGSAVTNWGWDGDAKAS